MKRCLIWTALASALATSCALLPQDAPGTTSTGSGGATSSSSSATTSSGGGGLSTGGGAPLLGCDPIVDMAATGDIVTVWSRPLPGIATATDSAGNILVGGGFVDNVDLGAGVTLDGPPNSYFVAKLSPAGEALWARVEPHIVESIVTDADGAFWTTQQGTAHSSVFAHDPAGTPLWNKTLDLYFPLLVAPQKNGIALVSGNIVGGPLDYGTGTIDRAGGASLDPALLAFDATGNVLWAKTFAGAVWPTPPSGEHWVLLEDLASAPGGGAFALVTAWASSEGSQLVLFRLTGAGDVMWDRRFPNAGAKRPTVAVGADGQTIVQVVLDEGGQHGNVGCGTFAGPGFGMAATTPDGTPAWTRTFYGNASFRKPRFDPHGNVVLAAMAGYPCDLGSGPLIAEGDQSGELVVARLGPNGALLESKVVTMPHTGWVSGVTSFVDPAGDLLVTGTYTDVLDLGAGPLPMATMQTTYLAKIKF